MCMTVSFAFALGPFGVSLPLWHTKASPAFAMIHHHLRCRQPLHMFRAQTRLTTFMRFPCATRQPDCKNHSYILRTSNV